MAKVLSAMLVCVFRMPEVCGFRQVDEKHVSSEVVQMLWSPRMDLIAVANIQGEVSTSIAYFFLPIFCFGR